MKIELKLVNFPDLHSSLGTSSSGLTPTLRSRSPLLAAHTHRGSGPPRPRPLVRAPRCDATGVRAATRGDGGRYCHQGRQTSFAG